MDIQEFFDLCVCDESKTNKKEEQGFVLFKGKFKGDCRKCGKYGHKASDCRSKVKTGKTKELTPKQKKENQKTIKCFKCQKMSSLQELRMHLVIVQTLN